MSCTDNRTINLNLFKIACINYQPNPVYYQGQSIQRQELISLQKVITNMAKEAVEQRLLSVYSEDGAGHETLPMNYSPEVPEMTPQKDSTRNNTNDLMSPHDFSQLTIRAKSKALELMKEFNFKDDDLRNLNALSKKQVQVKDTYFAGSQYSTSH